MPIETDTERAIFLSIEDFGTTVTKADDSTFSVIWDYRFVLVQPNGLTVGTESREPRVSARTSDVSELVIGDTLTIQSVGYTIRGVEPDGTGMTQLILERS